MKEAKRAKVLICHSVAQKASWRGGSCVGRMTVGGTLSRSSGDGGRGLRRFASESVSIGMKEDWRGSLDVLLRKV